jgi:hypothetical protein
MKLSPQKEIIVKALRDMKFHCGSEWLDGMKDDRKRIGELNSGYMKEKGFKIIGEPCDGRCGKNHSSGLYMRRAVPITPSLKPVNAPRSDFHAKHTQSSLSPENERAKAP